MKTLSVVGKKLLNLTAALALTLVLGSCGEDRPIVPIYTPPPTNTGPVMPVCGTVAGFPIGRQGTINYYSNIYQQGGYGGSTQSTMTLSVAYADQTSNNVVGSANLYLPMPSMYGQMSQTTPVCVTSRDQYTGQNFMGSGYPVSDSYGNYFIIQQLTMKGSMSTSMYGTVIPTPVTVQIGTACQSYLDLTNRKFYGCVQVSVGGTQSTLFVAQ